MRELGKCLHNISLCIKMAGVPGSLFLHYASFILYLAVLTCDYAYMNLPTHRTYAGRFKYLTFLSFLFGLFYNNMAAIFDFLVWTRERQSTLWRGIRDFTFTVIVIPMTMFVCAMFWILYTVNPRFMRSEEEEKMVPSWLNHGYHTLPIATVVLQAYAVQHKYPSKRTAFVALVVVESLYIAWLLYIAHHAQIWVYPFMEKMSIIEIVGFISVCVAISFGLYFIGKSFSDFCWRNVKEKSM